MMASKPRNERILILIVIVGFLVRMVFYLDDEGMLIVPVHDGARVFLRTDGIVPVAFGVVTGPVVCKSGPGT